MKKGQGASGHMWHLTGAPPRSKGECSFNKRPVVKTEGHCALKRGAVVTTRGQQAQGPTGAQVWHGDAGATLMGVTCRDSMHSCGTEKLHARMWHAEPGSTLNVRRAHRYGTWRVAPRLATCPSAEESPTLRSPRTARFLCARSRLPSSLHVRVRACWCARACVRAGVCTCVRV